MYKYVDKCFTSICNANNKNKLKKIDIIKSCMNKLNASKEETILIGYSIHNAITAKEFN